MPTSANTRRDPQKGKKEFSTNKGFTVIELLIAVAVLAILMSLALPSYRTIIEKRQVTSGAEQFTAFLSAAQSESVKRNQFVAVNYNWNGGAWCLGMTAGDDDSVDCDCTTASSCSLDGTEKVLSAAGLDKTNILDSATVGGEDTDGTIVFDPVRGLLVDGETAEFRLISPDQNMYALNIDMRPTGRLQICSSARGDKSVPGYSDCAGEVQP